VSPCGVAGAEVELVSPCGVPGAAEERVSRCGVPGAEVEPVSSCGVPAVAGGHDGSLPSASSSQRALARRRRTETDRPASTAGCRRPVPDPQGRPRAAARVAAQRVADHCALSARTNSARPRVARSRSSRERASPARSCAAQLPVACFAEAPALALPDWGRQVLRSGVWPHPPARSLWLGLELF